MANGLYTNSELIETIIDDLNTFLMFQVSGKHVQACAIVTGMAQKLMNLRNTIDNDIKNRDETIKKLKDALRECGHEIVELPPEEYTKKYCEVKHE